MNGFTLLKRGECVICNGARKDCRKSNDSGMVFCRESSANPFGYIFRGLDRWGFGLWQPTGDAEAFVEKSKEEWQREQEQRRIENERRRQQQIASQLPAVDRDKYYQKILNQLPLTPDSLASLEARGFAPEQIKADGYKSVNQWERVNDNFPSNLPGVLSSGSLNSQPGIIFPVRDVGNRIAALSIRLTDGSNGRYRWLTSATRKNPDGATPHLNGELPLSVFEPEENRGDAIWLSEGVGIKPSLARYRLGVPVVGASSGLFSGSPDTCKFTLEKLLAKYQTQKLIIAPDAGDIQNKHVCQRWAGEFEFLRSLGYRIEIAWWNQINKDDADIDELNDLSVISFINPEKFLSWAERGEIGKSASAETSPKLPQKQSTQNQPTSKDKSHKPGKTLSSKTAQESLLSPQSTISGILNPPLTASFPIQSLKDGISKVLPIPKSVESCWTTEKAPREERRWFERVLKRVKKVFSKNDSKSKLPRLGFKCFEVDNPEFEEKIRQVQRKLRSLSYEADIELSQRYLPNELVNQLPKSGLIGIKAPKGCGKSVLLKKIIALAKKQGIPVLSITPRIALGREQAIKWEITWIDDYGVLQTRAGDTTSQIQEVAEKRAKAREKLAELEAIKHNQLNLLGESEKETLEQQKTDLRIEIERFGEEIENINSASVRTLALCWDSLWRTKDRDFKEALIIIDEAELGFQHFISGSTCKRNRPQLLQVFKTKLIECLMSGGRVILSDADLTDLPINYVREILPIPIKPFVVINDYIGDETRWIVDLRTGSRGNTLTDIIQVTGDGKYLAITTDSQAEAQALERRILKEFPDEFCAFLDSDGNITDKAQARKKALIVRIDRTTTESEAGKKFIQKPNEQILHWQPRILIYTPSMGVGVSIDESTQRWDEEWEEMVPYFDAVYGLFFGVIEPSQCRQQLARVRANVPRIVWCKEANKALEGCSSFFPDEVKRQTLKYNHSALNILDIAKGIAGYEADDEEIREAMLQLLTEAWDKDSRCWKEPSIDLASAFKARENYGKWNLANLLREELQDEGHTVISLKGIKTDEVGVMAEIKDDQKMEEATLIAESPLMPVEEAREVINKLDETKERYRSAQKSLLQEELPEVKLTPAFIKKAVIDDRRRWLNQQKLFWYLTNDEALKQTDTDHWLGSLKRFAQGIPFMRDVRSRSPKVDALRKSGVFEFINLEDCEAIYESDTPEAQKFLKRCLKHKDLLQTALNVLVTKKSSPIGLANRILGKVGLMLEKFTRSHKDKRWRLAADLVNDPDRRNVLKAFGLRWQMSQEEAQKNEAEKQAQTNTQQATQPGGQSADLYIYKSDFPPQDLEVSQGGYEQSQAGGEVTAAAVCSEPQKSPQIQSQEALEVGGQSADYINQNMSSPPHIDEVSQGVGEPLAVVPAKRQNPIEELVETLPYCDTIQTFAAVVGGYSYEAVEAAIALQDTQHRRQELELMWEVVADVRLLQSVTDWSQVTIPQERLDEAWKLLDATEQNRLHALCQTAQQPVERQWGITRVQAEMGGSFEWVRGGFVRVAYAAADFVKLITGEFVSYRELRVLQ